MKTITSTYKRTFLFNFIGGVAWGLGVTAGISLIAYLLGLSLKTFEAMPLVGEKLADIVEHTLKALESR